MSASIPHAMSPITAVSVASNSTVVWEFISRISDPTTNTSATSPNDTAQNLIPAAEESWELAVLECTIGDLGTNYMGSRDTVTVNGTDHSCQPWAAIAPNIHFYTNASLFPDSSLEDANNFCRNPSADPIGPWCYNNDFVTFVEQPVLYCDLPRCELGKTKQWTFENWCRFWIHFVREYFSKAKYGSISISIYIYVYIYLYMLTHDPFQRRTHYYYKCKDIQSHITYLLQQLNHVLHVMNTLRHGNALWTTGPWFNINMTSYQYRKSHCGDKMIVKSSYLHNVISFTGKMTSLYWLSARFFVRCILRSNRLLS